MAIKDLKDWTENINGLSEMDDAGVHNLYSDMLATAHDINYRVPDDQLVETEDAAVIRKVIPALHEGIVKHHAEARAEAKNKAKAKKVDETTAPAPVKKKKTAAANAAKDKPKKPGKDEPAEQVNVSKETNMANATAKKVAPKKAAAKKTAPAKAPAKKAAAKKAPAKKAAATNARTPVARNPFGENAKIKVLNKETGIRPDSERGRRVAVVFKYNGKKVADFYKEEPPYNRTETLRFLIDRKFIEVK